MSFETPLPPFSASDPSATFLNSSALDLLLIEIVPLARRLAIRSTNAAGEGEGEGGGGGGVEGTAAATDDEEEEQQEAMFYRLEQLGFKVGQGLVERYVTEGGEEEAVLGGGEVFG